MLNNSWRATPSEDAARQLVALRYEAGDRAGAIHEYDAFARRLRDELGVAPMPETQALRELVLRNAPLPDMGDSPGPAALPTGADRPAALLPFVGRDVEMAQAAAWWSRAARGDHVCDPRPRPDWVAGRREGGLALIGGEASVGKTRLAREVALLAEDQGGRVLYGACAPHPARAYQPVVEALEAALPLIAALELEPVRLAALAVLLPELGQRRRLPALSPLEPDRERIRLFDAVAGCLERLAEPRPLLVILENLHWASEATIALIEFLARRAVQHPILLLGTYRDEETPRGHPLRALRRQLQSEGLVEHLALGRLSLPAVETLLARLAGEVQPNPPAPFPVKEGGAFPLLVGEGPGVRSWAARLYAESEGHPLIIELLWQDWQEHGVTESAGLPGGVRAAIAQWLERLPPAARAYAEAAAVAGPTFDAETVRDVGGWNEAQAFAALESLLDRRLVCDAGGRGHFAYAFTHHLIQAAEPSATGRARPMPWHAWRPWPRGSFAWRMPARTTPRPGSCTAPSASGRARPPCWLTQSCCSSAGWGGTVKDWR